MIVTFALADDTAPDFAFVASCLEGLLFGLYSGIFAIYLQYHGSKEGNNKTKKILFYAVCVLYALSTATVILDVAWIDINFNSVYMLEIFRAVMFAFCDFISQFILIYRCWIVWHHNICVVSLPSFLAFTFLVIWIAAGATPMSIALQGQYFIPDWGYILTVTGLVLSMSVNALVTGLIVFRIFKVFREVKTTADDKMLGATGGSTLRRVIFMLIESGMALFSVQLARLVVIIVHTNAGNKALQLIIALHDMFNGIIPTIILVRVSIGVSFHDKNSMEASIRSLQFAPIDVDSISETASIDIVDKERKNDDIEIQFSDGDIQMVKMNCRNER